MAVRPSGTVTFLFTDVEGSTRLWAADGGGMSASLRVHDEIVRQVIEEAGGYVFTTAGDAFCAAFDRASGAVGAASEIQRQLGSVVWPGPELRVRIGLHLGEAEERASDYFGPVVNTAARVEQAAHGGQVLMTDVVRSAADVPARDLGLQSLRDVGEPIRLFQLGGGDFGRLRGLADSAVRLPRQNNRLVGRERDKASVMELCAAHRLVTVSGAGGVGKTRLAIEAAGSLADRFDGGAAFVDLASTADSGSVPAAFAKALRVSASGGTPVLDQLIDHLSSLRMLLVVDNCEHLLDEAAEVVTEILDRCDDVVVLATSREVLDLDAEHVYRVPSLPAEDAGSAAVRLFVERAASVDARFDPSAADMSSIVAICQRLEGIPLAVELAAARARVLTVRDIELRLVSRFDLLAGSRRGRLRRQQTLRAAIEWSVDLLDDADREFLRRLGVFVGGWSLKSVGPVTGVSDIDAVDLLDSLVSKSLIERFTDEQGTGRYRMLETLRQWALEECNRVGTLGELRSVHAHHFVTEALKWPIDEVMTLPNADFLDAWKPELSNVVAAVEHLCASDVNQAAELLIRLLSLTADAGRGDWFVDRVVECLNGNLDERLGSICLFNARIGMETQMRLAEQRELPERFRSRIPGEKYEGYALNRWWTEYHRMWGDPFSTDERVKALTAELVALETGEQILRACRGLRAFSYALTARFTEALSEALEAGHILMAINVGLVAGYLANDDRVSTLVELAHSFETRLGMNTLGLDAYRILADQSIDSRPRALAEIVTSDADGVIPAQESDFLAVYARLAYERGDLDRSRELLTAARLRQPATFALIRWTHCDLDAITYQNINNLKNYREHLAQATRLDNPSHDRTTTPEPQQSERTLLNDEANRWL